MLAMFSCAILQRCFSTPNLLSEAAAPLKMPSFRKSVSEDAHVSLGSLRCSSFLARSSAQVLSSGDIHSDALVALVSEHDGGASESGPAEDGATTGFSPGLLK